MHMETYTGIVKKTAHPHNPSSSLIMMCIKPLRAFDERRKIVLVGRISTKTIIVSFDPVKDKLSHLFTRHGGTVQPVDQLFFQRCEKALHPCVIETTVCSPHALLESIFVKQFAVFMAGILCTVVGMQDQISTISVARNRITNSCAAQTGARMCIHRKTDDCAVKTIHKRSKIQLAIGTVDLRDVAETLHTGRRGREIPPHQIIALQCALIAFCQAVRALLSRQKSVFIAQSIAFSITGTQRRLQCIPQAAHPVAWVLLP